jgi:hypothetical protein
MEKDFRPERAMKCLIPILTEILLLLAASAVDVEEVTKHIRSATVKIEVPLDTAVFNAQRLLRSEQGETGAYISAVCIFAVAQKNGELLCAWWQLKDPVARIVTVALTERNIDLLQNKISYLSAQCARFREPEAAQRRAELEFLRQNVRAIKKALDDRMGQK